MLCNTGKPWSSDDLYSLQAVTHEASGPGRWLHAVRTVHLPQLQEMASVVRAGLVSAWTRCHLPKMRQRTGHLRGEAGCDELRLCIDDQQLKSHTTTQWTMCKRTEMSRRLHSGRGACDSMSYGSNAVCLRGLMHTRWVRCGMDELSGR
jgi:hypothetical protein